MIHAVIVHIIQDGRILLHYKKRGHGKGYWNGLGGKIEEGESPEECALREAREEMGAEIENPIMLGEILFHDVQGEDWKVYVFRAKLKGEPVESEESMPRWFPLESIPYGEMWEDDRYWLPLVVNGIKFQAEFWFRGKEMRRFNISAWKESQDLSM